MPDEEQDVEARSHTSRGEKGIVASTLSEKGSARLSPSDGKEERKDAAKRPRRANVDMAARSRRMFGLLNSTLSKAKEDNERRNNGEAAKKRAEIEARMKEKLKVEKEIIKQHSNFVEDLTLQLSLGYNLSMDIQSIDSMIRLRKAQKRRLASFMITPSESSRYDGEKAKRIAADGRVVAADIASCLAPLPSRPTPDLAIYYLPKRMLPKQDDKLDDQEDRVDDAIDEADQAWKKKRETMQQDLDRIKEIIKNIGEEMLKTEKGEQVAKRINDKQND